ncbi:protein of unknown function [Bradyrhizobium vignae]|uniref:Sigma-54 factor interaction domain-containing protein n=1 Tax=Bradyrhizobium vignae TaxID=1549949 RepID=A0A2U3Q9I4_9BRAD|nr:protein of unknown function [Bradyrhizobium vignae]
MRWSRVVIASQCAPVGSRPTLPVLLHGETGVGKEVFARAIQCPVSPLCTVRAPERVGRYLPSYPEASSKLGKSVDEHATVGFRPEIWFPMFAARRG